MLFVDGPEGAGKTTLARSIAYKQYAQYIRVRMPEGEQRFAADFALALSDCILDRWALSEAVLRPGSIPLDRLYQLGLAAQTSGSVGIVLGDWSKEHWWCPKLYGTGQVTEAVDRWRTMRLLSRSYQGLHGEGWGSLVPTVVLFSTQAVYHSWTSFPQQTNQHLFRVLYREGLFPENVHFMCALTRKGQAVDLKLLSLLKPGSVVCLDKGAKKALTERGLTGAGSLAHPRASQQALRDAIEEGAAWRLQ